MTQAMTRIVEQLIGAPPSAESQEELSWQCRELLDNVAGHPCVSSLFTVVARSGAHIWFDLSCTGAFDGIGTRQHVAAVKIRFIPTKSNPADIAPRWRFLGFSIDEIVVPRSEIQSPFPLKGEAGYEALTLSRRSIYAPPNSGMPPRMPPYSHLIAHKEASSNPMLERYRAGEYAQVWDELLAVPDIRNSPLSAAAIAVARETMSRARQNVEQIAAKLQAMDYEFVEPDEMHVPPTSDVLDRIAEIEAKVGPMPLSLAAWLELVGSVDFRGRHDDIAVEHPNYPDPLVVSPAEWLLTYDQENWYRHRYRLDIAPDEYHKEDISGGPPYSMAAPCFAADAELEYEWHRTTFVAYLRECFRCGGFPGLARASDEESQRVVRHLAEGLLPL
jgi:hypothetical protein